MTKTSFLVSFLGGASLCLTMYILASLGRFAGWCAARGIVLPGWLQRWWGARSRDGSWSKGVAFASAWTIHPGLSATLFGAIGMAIHVGLGAPAVASLYAAMVGSLLLTLGIATLSWQKLFEPSVVRSHRPTREAPSQPHHHAQATGLARCDHQLQGLPFVPRSESLAAVPSAATAKDPEPLTQSQKKKPCMCSPDSSTQEPTELEV